MRTLALMVLFALGALVAGCSDDTKQPTPDGGKKDTLRKEAAVGSEGGGGSDLLPDTKPKTDLPPADSKLGEGCGSAKDCSKDAALCLMPEGSKGVGICSMECTGDDPGTPLINEDSCPNGYLCASFAYTTKTYYYCLKKCTPSLTKNDCPASSNRACHPSSTRYGDLEVAVCWYLKCTDGKDCPVFSDTKCVIDSDCTSIAADAFCDSSRYLCARPGKCEASGLCGNHSYGKATAKVGDPCKNDFDCPPNGECLNEVADPNGIGVSWRNGYCTIPGCSFATSLTNAACPTGSTCNHLYYGGLCNKTCKLDAATDCRNNSADKGGDYECYAWNNLVIGSTNVTAEPVCVNAASQTCDSLGTKLTCASLGTESGNTTNMDCRDRYTGVVKANKADPNGVCLDDTASGPFEAPKLDGGPKPDTTVKADLGTPDKGPAKDAAKDAGAAIH